MQGLMLVYYNMSQSGCVINHITHVHSQFNYAAITTQPRRLHSQNFAASKMYSITFISISSQQLCFHCVCACVHAHVCMRACMHVMGKYIFMVAPPSEWNQYQFTLSLSQTSEIHDRFSHIPTQHPLFPYGNHQLERTSSFRASVPKGGYTKLAKFDIMSKQSQITNRS